MVVTFGLQHSEGYKGVTMTNVAVLTDSTASIPEDLLERLHIQTVAYYIHLLEFAA